MDRKTLAANLSKIVSEARYDMSIVERSALFAAARIMIDDARSKGAHQSDPALDAVQDLVLPALSFADGSSLVREESIAQLEAAVAVL